MRLAFRSLLVTGIASAALWLPAAATSAAATHITFFRTPSGNIYCARIHTRRTNQLRCDVRRLKHQAPRPRGCKFDWGTSFGMGGRGHAHALCVSDSVFDPHAKVLAYGTRHRFGPFRCKSKTTGLRCKNRSRHGFFLNRTRYRLF